MTELTSASEISNNVEKSTTETQDPRILSVEEQLGAAKAAESAWNNENSFRETKELETQHTLLLIEALNRQEITPHQFADTVASRIAEKVITGEIDEVTQGDNRSGGEKKSIKELVRAVRYQTPTTGFMIDLDEFKPANDEMGHLVGDQALFSAAQHIRTSVREYDLPFRWGGDEFFVTLPNTHVEEAVKSVGIRLVENAAEAIRDQMEGMGIELTNDITFSIGSAEDVPPTENDNIDAETRLKNLTELADKATLVSKYRGKNRLTIGMIRDNQEIFKDPATNETFTAEFELKGNNESGRITKLIPYNP